MDTPEILTKAAEVIEMRGWYQGGYVPAGPVEDYAPNTCPVCVLAAINVAANHDPDEGFCDGGERADAAIALAAFLRLDDRLTEYDEEGIENVVGNDWNDCTATSAEQVTKALRECAAELKAGAR